MKNGIKSGFKETELGLIPLEWNESNLGDHSNILTGFPFKSKLFSDEGIKLVRGDNVTRGNLRWGDKTRFWPEITPEFEKYSLRNKDVILSMDGSLVGKNYARIKNSDLPLLLVQRVARIRAKSTIYQDFIYYLISSVIFKEYVDLIKTGTSIPHISVKQIKEFNFPLPNFSEQKQISIILNSLDSKIELNNRMNQTLEKISRIIFKFWFVQFEFPDELSRPYKLNGGEMVDSELGEIPKSWEIGTFADLCNLNANSWTSNTIPSEIYYVDLANTKNGIISDVQIFIREDAPSRARRILLADDTIFGTVRPGNRSFSLIGNSDLQLTGSTGFAVLSPKYHALREMIYLMATSEQNINKLTWLADGAAYPAVRPEVVVNEKCILPPKKVILDFHKVVGPLFDQILFNRSQEFILSNIRDSLLPKLMSGKIRVNNKNEVGK